MSDEEQVTVTMAKDAARTFVNVLLDAAAGDKPPDREWLLWGVGMIAQAGKHSPEGPDVG